MTDLSQLVWRKSSRSNGADACVEVAVRWRTSSRSMDNGACVEVATLPDRVLVRDSKDPSGPVLAVDPAAWHTFLTALDHG